MNDKEYMQSLETKTIDELVAELQKTQDNLEMLFMLNNSLDGLDITEGGGEPADQARYQTLKFQQTALTQEINKRHLLEMLK
jgi:hypothetical protein